MERSRRLQRTPTALVVPPPAGYQPRMTRGSPCERAVADGGGFVARPTQASRVAALPCRRCRERRRSLEAAQSALMPVALRSPTPTSVAARPAIDGAWPTVATPFDCAAPALATQPRAAAGVGSPPRELRCPGLSAQCSAAPPLHAVSRDRALQYERALLTTGACPPAVVRVGLAHRATSPERSDRDALESALACAHFGLVGHTRRAPFLSPACRRARSC
mmetsp:Transcript_22702/g.79382  ORF Transcript_22702/g.79382 Transcript_22702/m.79382 type:complete len:220 (+) Transcript_22702:738-1397(+)